MAVKKVDTKENPTNMFTKPISQSMFMHCVDLLNVDCWCHNLPFGGGAKRPKQIRQKRFSPREKTSGVATNVYLRKTLEKPKKTKVCEF